jgi:hypothetical protein
MMNAGNDFEVSSRRRKILVFLWIFGFGGSLCVFALGVLDQVASGKITEVLGVKVSKTFAGDVVSLDVMRLREVGILIGRILHGFIMQSFGVGSNTGRGWPLVALVLATCIFMGGVLSALGRFILRRIGK